MPRPTDETPRVLGPIWLESRQSYRVTTIYPGAAQGTGRARSRHFACEEEAKDYRDVKLDEIARMGAATVSGVLDDYEKHLTAKGNAESGVTETMRRLRLFFDAVQDRQLARLSAVRAAQLYAAFRVGRSVDYHRNTLGNARGFLGWCVEQRLTSGNVLADVKGVGKRSAGKLQLTGDEARAFHHTALAMAAQEDTGALGAAMLLTMGLRQSEVRLRMVRDLDLGGTVLRIERAKTRKGNRVVGVPEVLQSRLLEQAEERTALEPLFPAHDGGWHTRAWLIAAVKRVCLRAGVPVVCPHGLRGTHATLAMQLGVGTRAVADALGHEDARTTLRHYAEPGAGEGAQAARAFAVISGGKR